MADESQRSSNSIGTCQLSPFFNTIHLGPERPFVTSGHIYRPLVSSIFDRGTDLAATSSAINKIQLFLAEAKQQSSVPSQEPVVQNHEVSWETDDNITMLGRSTGALTVSTLQSFRDPHLETPTATSSGNSTEKTPTPTRRQDSGFYEARDAEDDEWGGGNAVAQNFEVPHHDFADVQQEEKGITNMASELVGADSSLKIPGVVPETQELSRILQEDEDDDDERSELDVDTQARQMRARERVVISRGRVSRTRQTMRSHRSEVRQLRDDFRNAVGILVRKVNELAAMRDLPDIVEYTEAFRTAQDKLGPAEEAYDRWEMRLDDEEDDLEEEEDYFYRHYEVTDLKMAESKLDEVMSPRIKPYLLTDNEPPELAESAKVRKYSEKVAVANQLKEDIDDLDNDFFRVSSDSAFRKRHGIALSAEATDFLADYPKQHGEIVETLRALEDEIFDLRGECLEEHLFEPSDLVYVHYDALYDDVMDSVFEARERSPLRVAADHMKYKTEQNFADKQQYVNSWLMEWVQYSAVDILMLKTLIYFKFPQYPKEGIELNDQSWPELALKHWDTDNAGIYANTNNKASRLDAIAGSPGRLHGTASDTGRSGMSDSLRYLDEHSEDNSMSSFNGGDAGSINEYQVTHMVEDFIPRSRSN